MHFSVVLFLPSFLAGWCATWRVWQAMASLGSHMASHISQ